jgi:hypothetical protein
LTLGGYCAPPPEPDLKVKFIWQSGMNEVEAVKNGRGKTKEPRKAARQTREGFER